MNGSYQPGDVVFENWTLKKVLGAGSFGKVFEAERDDFGIRSRAAVKIVTIPQNRSEVEEARVEGMDEASAASYFRGVVNELVLEIAHMSRLKGHTHVVGYEDHMVRPHEDGIGWDVMIRMELLTPLMDRLKDRGLARDEVIRLGIDMCKALELCAHYSIIHRDIKPENIFVCETGEYKLGDFGISRTVEKTTGGLSRKGTYTYMAPEVFRGDPYGPSVDIFSLGIVLYRLLNGNRAPFLPAYPEPITHSLREEALARRMAGEPLPPPMDADPALAEIVLKACAFDPKARWAGPAEMRQALEALLNEDTVVSLLRRGIIPRSDPEPVPDPKPPLRNPKWLTALGMVFAALLAAGTAALLAFFLPARDDTPLMKVVLTAFLAAGFTAGMALIIHGAAKKAGLAHGSGPLPGENRAVKALTAGSLISASVIGVGVLEVFLNYLLYYLSMPGILFASAVNAVMALVLLVLSLRALLRAGKTPLGRARAVKRLTVVSTVFSVLLLGFSAVLVLYGTETLKMADGFVQLMPLMEAIGAALLMAFALKALNSPVFPRLPEPIEALSAKVRRLRKRLTVWTIVSASVVALEAVLLFLIYWELNIESIDGWQALVFPPMAGGVTAMILGLTLGKKANQPGTD